jgi:hypothetical protein
MMRPPRIPRGADVRVLGRRRSWRRDAGFVLVVQVLMLGVLMTMTALAVDVGSFYSRAAEVQKASDAAALAAVVWMPDDFTTATSAARDAAGRNGFTHGTNGITVVVASVPGNPRQVRVTITDPSVPTIFGRMITDKISITRDSVAEYVLAVPLGSPDSNFGNTALGASSPNFWAAINGPYTAKVQGDPFATRCTNSVSASSCQSANGEYRAAGYLYAVEVPAGSAGRTLTVEIFDAAFNARGGIDVETGDYQWYSGGLPLSYELYEADSTPLDNEDNPTLNGRCSTGLGKLTYAAGAAGTANAWTTLCTFTTTRTGVYPLRVRSAITGSTSEKGYATASYSVRSSLTGAGAQPRVYGIGDMSIVTQAGGAATFNLAEVAQIHAGKTFEIELFDPGDGSSGDYFLSILQPDGTTATCRYTDTSGVFGSSGPCSIQTRNNSASPANKYNGLWLTIRVDLPTSYTCTTCWWKVKYTFSSGSQPTDRTTWRASILGDPVHLVE